MSSGHIHQVATLYSMKALKALTLSLGDINDPVITRYQLGLIVFRLYKLKKYKGEPINLQKSFAEAQDFSKYVNRLLDEGVLNHHKNFPRTVYSLLGRSKDSSDEVACTIDPFCYVSHLSAMSYHGLSDRMPSKLFISSPAPMDWKTFAEEQMKKDLKDDYGEYCENGLPKLLRIQMKKIGKTEIHRVNSKHQGAYKNVKDRSLRVSTIGRTFLDMLRNPELCGGINHVLEVFDEYANQYLKLITDEIDNNGNKIDKVRAGYIIDERLNIKNGIVQKWAQFAQRGGSRKLDSSTEYVPKWSDKWCISINTFE